MRGFLKRVAGLSWSGQSAAAAAHVAPEEWLTARFVVAGRAAAFAEACQRFDVTLVGDTRSRFPHKSIGGEVRGRDGSRSWLKVNGLPAGVTSPLRTRELAAASIAGISKPAVLDKIDWRGADGVQWRALRMSCVDHATIATLDRSIQPVTDDWIMRLKDQLARLSAIPSSDLLYTPKDISHAIVTHFGPDAPRRAREWRTAHGDLILSNLTGPELVLLDWESWGRAPCGYDIGYLIVHSADYPDLIARLEAAFAEELATLSGRVGLLFTCAMMFNRLERFPRDPGYRRTIEAVARRALMR